MMERNGVVPPGLLRPAIAESWRRCLANGMNPHKPPKPDRLTSRELDHQRERHATARALANHEMQALHRQLGVSSFVLAFAGPDGTLLDSIVAETL
ncbi:MAG: sigma-54-dependent Fis family transcriptional regulator, partial [Acidocella sp.]|nr:sigma-54-dependent Fis family transcriptional regulator [Acidocella sp.]